MRTDHIVHHLLSLWALGATPSEVQAAYNLNKRYQLPHYHHAASTSTKLKEPSNFRECLGKSEFYTDYLHFFQDNIAERGVEEVVKEYLFKGDELAGNILGRMYSGLEVPIQSPHTDVHKEHRLLTSIKASNIQSCTLALPSNSANPVSSLKPSPQHRYLSSSP